jgi:hypothetical protein
MRDVTQGTWARFHPLTRIVIGVAVVLIVAFGAGLDRIGSALASISPAGTFEQQCGDLPQAAVDVAVAPPRVIENHDTPFDALTRLSEGPSPAHRTIGLTLANFGHRSTFEVKGLEDRQRGRACVRPRVAVELYLRPLTVYVAREYSGDPCRARVIREHEERHVQVYVAFAEEAAAQLRDDLRRAIGDAPHFAASIREAQGHVDRQVATTLDGFMREAQRTLNERQAHIDTPEEYERVRSSCDTPPA